MHFPKILFATITLGTAQLALGSTLYAPDATYFLQVSDFHANHNYTTWGSYNTGGATATAAGATAGSCSGNCPAPFATADAVAGPNQSMSASVDMTYFIEYSGPNGNLPLIADVHLDGYRSFPIGPGFSNASFHTSLSISGPGVSWSAPPGACDGVSACPPYTYDYSGSAILTLQANQVYQVDLHVDAYASLGFNNTGQMTSHADADPYFHFDPSFDGSSYTVLMSPGLSNAALGTPEPGTLGLGVLALGLLQWRRRFNRVL